MSYVYTFGTVLRKLRGANRLTSKEVAEGLKIPEPVLVAYEQDNAIPTNLLVQKLASTYGVPQGLLFWYAQDSLTPVEKAEVKYDYHETIRQMMQSEVDLYETAILHNLTAKDARQYPEKNP